jgi:hypothetical protein
MGNAAIAEELLSTGELDELFRLSASESSPEDDEDEDDDDLPEDDDDDEDEEEIHPDDMPQG